MPHPSTRLRSLLAAGLAAALLAAPARAQEPTHPDEDASLLDARTMRAIDAGLAYLASRGNPDGSFGEKPEFRIATTALAGLAFLAGGNVPGRGRYGKQVDAAVGFFLDLADRNTSGYFSDQNEKSRMHGHAYATLFLAEVYGMTRDEASRERLRPAIERAVHRIVTAQEERTGGPEDLAMGGWGYDPGDMTHEGSITVCCLQALRAARDVGFKVPRHTLVKALRYLIESQNDDGSFKYRIGGGSSHSTLPLTAAAISTFNAFGVYDDGVTQVLGEQLPMLPRMMRKALEYMELNIDNVHGDGYYRKFWYYSIFYTAQSYYKSRFRGQDRRWSEYYRKTREDLLAGAHEQQPTGAWEDETYSATYATSIATLVLQIPMGYLPIFQR